MASSASTLSVPERRATTHRRLPLPRVWPLRASDVVALLVGNGLLILAMWVRHGGLDELSTLAGTLTAIGQLTALAAAYLSLIGLVLVGRSPWLDQLFGMDRLASAHRWIGFATLWLILAHGVFTTVGYALGDGRNVVDEFVALVLTYPYVLWATVSGGLFVAIAVSSIRAARRRLSYETWFGIHLYAYLAILLGLAHQLVVGTDFSADPVAWAYWVALYVITGLLIVAFRFGQPVLLTLRHRPRVANTVRESPDVVSIYIDGRNLDRLPMRAGQYFIFRFLTLDDWWRGRPFSLSAAPNGRFLRITVKDLGDDTRRVQRMPIGTRVFLEGPYGVFTGAARRRRGVVLVAGGIGITPLRALLEALPAAPGDLVLLYRAKSPDDLVFRDELEHLARARGATVQYLVGRRRDLGFDPLAPRRLQQLVPDLPNRDVYVCGPAEMTDAVRLALRRLAVPDRQVHFERFAY